MTTFDFGAGPVPAHQHPNGGGWVADTATVADTAHVGHDARIYDNAEVYGSAQVHGSARIFGNAKVYGSARVSDDAWVSGNARIYGRARVSGSALVSGTAQVESTRHVLTVGPVGSENQTVTLWKTADGHGLSVGCWQDHTIDELAAEVLRRAPGHVEEYALIEALLRHRTAEWEAAS